MGSTVRAVVVFTWHVHAEEPKLPARGCKLRP
jgi:hypothetical protein